MSADLPGGACPVEAGVRTKEVIGSGSISDDVRGPLLLLMSEIAASSGCRGLLTGGGSGTGLSTTIATDATFGWEYSPGWQPLCGSHFPVFDVGCSGLPLVKV